MICTVDEIVTVGPIIETSQPERIRRADVGECEGQGEAREGREHTPDWQSDPAHGRARPGDDSRAPVSPTSPSREGAGPSRAPGPETARGRALVERLAHRQWPPTPPWPSAPCRMGGGTSSAGFLSKKPTGLSAKPMYETGMTGQSSGRTTWCVPNVYHTTRSVFSSGASSSP